MTKLLLTLGPGLKPGPHGDVVVLDWSSGKVIDELRYRHRVYEQSHKGLAGASLFGRRLLAATETELLEIELAPLKLIEARTFSFLNDVHHLAAAGDRICVCNTGLDCIEEFDADWRAVATHHLVRRFGRRPGHVWTLLRDDLRKSWRRMRGWYDQYTHLSRRPPFRNLVKLCWENAYRRNGHERRFSDFRPHVLHPNHVLPMGDDLWVTLWRPGRIVSLRTGKTLAEDLGRPHDGLPVEDRFYVTDCQANRLIVYEFDPDGPDIGARIAERTITGSLHEGFLRGVTAVGDHVFVGLTVRRGAPRECQSARIVALDRRTLDAVDEWTIPQEYGQGVFSILDVSRMYA